MKPIRLTLSETSQKIPCGKSRFWGNPDLPDGITYPMYTDNEGNSYPYIFLCQINLTEIAPYDSNNLLPHEGILSFFIQTDYYLGNFNAEPAIGSNISSQEAVKVMYFPSCEHIKEVTLSDKYKFRSFPHELQVCFSPFHSASSEEHMFFAPPSHRPWETWDPPYEEWIILLQIDSFEGADFQLNFMDSGVLNLLISPSDLKAHCFNHVRALVLSS